MHLDLLDRIGDWNPQLFREIKGRLNVRNIAITVVTSLLGQLLLFMSWLSKQPIYPSYRQDELYCRLRDTYLSYQQENNQLQQQYHQLQTQFSRYSGKEHFDLEKLERVKGSIAEVKGKLLHVQALIKENICPPNAIDYPLWWQDHYPKIFASLSVFVLFILLGIGTYMLISNLAHEERRGTLNFIRLSPQSTLSILSGKLLGVPILLYLAAVLTVPFHVWMGLSAHISLVEIFSFYAVLIASCAFFYSAALLFGLVTSWLGGFQSWLGAGGILIFLCLANFHPIEQISWDWLNLFSPSVILPYLVDRTGSRYTGLPFFSHGMIQNWTWFNLPIGATGFSLVLFALLNYGLWTGWIWQALNRRFHNPNATILSKQQSYWLVACFEVVLLGFAVQGQTENYKFWNSLNGLWFSNLLLLFGLMAVLSPHRQTLLDWARYRRERRSQRKGFWNRSVVQDLIWGEKSPAVVAMVINLAIAATFIVPWIVLVPTESINKIQVLLGVAFFCSLMIIYATIAQLMLSMKTNKRSLWAAGTIGALVVLPVMTLALLGVQPSENATLFLFSTFPWAAIEYTATTTTIMALLGEWSVLVLLNLQLTRQLRRAGESASKALFAGCPSLPN